MLPKPREPERGSRKVINGKEFVTKHNFTTGVGNVLQTVEGDYILPNGELAKDKAILELLPGQHKELALEWWENHYGARAKIPPSSESKNQSKEDEMEDLRETIAILKKQIDVLMARSNAGDTNGQAGVDTEKPVTKKGTPKTGVKKMAEIVQEELEELK